jgi:hypothetical protein
MAMREAQVMPVSAAEAAKDKSSVLSVPMDDDLVARFASFSCRNRDFETREEAARHILRLWLTENGYNGVHQDAGTRPEALNASNDD